MNLKGDVLGLGLRVFKGFRTKGLGFRVKGLSRSVGSSRVAKLRLKMVVSQKMGTPI